MSMPMYLHDPQQAADTLAVAPGLGPATSWSIPAKLRSLSQQLLHLAIACNPQQDGQTPDIPALVNQIECAVQQLETAVRGSSCRSTANCDGQDGIGSFIKTPICVREGTKRHGKEQYSRGRSPGYSPTDTRLISRSTTPRRPFSDATPPRSPYPVVPRDSRASSGSPSFPLPETPVRNLNSPSDLALERSLASLSIDAGAIDTVNRQRQPTSPTSPCVTAAAAVSKTPSKAKPKAARTSSQLTPATTAAHPTKRSRQSPTPPNRPSFSLGVLSSTTGVTFVRTPVVVAPFPTCEHPSPSSGHALVPECTPPRSVSPLRVGNRSRRSRRSLTPRHNPLHALLPSHASPPDSDDDDAIVFVSSTPAVRPPLPSRQSAVVILSDSDSEADASSHRPAVTRRHSITRPTRRPAIPLSSPSSSDSDADAPATPSRCPAAPRTPAAHPPATAATSRDTPRRTGGTLQKKLELLRNRYTPRREVASPSTGGRGWRRAVVVVESDEEGEHVSARKRDKVGDDQSGSEENNENELWESGDEVDKDENQYDSSFIDDGSDEDDYADGSKAEPPTTPYIRRQPLGDVPSTPLTAAAFARTRAELTAKALAEFNASAFDDQLPATLCIEWNKRLCTTAGRAWPRRFKPSADTPVPPGLHVADDGWVYDARVELSVKVLDSEEKLRRTLLHELCHVAAWMLDHVAKPPHGPRFWHWAKKATRAFPDLKVTTCHDYEIQFKFKYTCTQCGYSFGRHSKSVNVQQKVCGVCHGGQLEVTRMAGLGVAGGTPVGSPARAMSAYQVFVKAQYAQVKQAAGGRTHKEVMGVLSQMWAEERRKRDSGGDGGPDVETGEDDGVGEKGVVAVE